MADQLGLDLDEQPPKARADTPPSYHVRAHQTVAEVEAGESRAARQDVLVLEVFRTGRRLTPSQVEDILVETQPPPVPLLTSIRRSMSNLTRRGLLIHYKADRRAGPRGARESTWGLA